MAEAMVGAQHAATRGRIVQPRVGEGQFAPVEARFDEIDHGAGVHEMLERPDRVFLARLPAPGIEIRDDCKERFSDGVFDNEHGIKPSVSGARGT